jgi:hypothetical protein
MGKLTWVRVNRPQGRVCAGPAEPGSEIWGTAPWCPVAASGGSPAPPQPATGTGTGSQAGPSHACPLAAREPDSGARGPASGSSGWPGAAALHAPRKAPTRSRALTGRLASTWVTASGGGRMRTFPPRASGGHAGLAWRGIRALTSPTRPRFMVDSSASAVPAL